MSRRGGDTPVPIPNTTVKPFAAEGTMLVTAWENRWAPDFKKKKQFRRGRSSRATSASKAGKNQKQQRVKRIKRRETDGGVAQLGEHLPCKQGVKSSNLSISTARELNENES